MSLKQLTNLTDKFAVITGGSRGLGLPMAEALGELGAKLVITARKTHELENASEQHLRAQDTRHIIGHALAVDGGSVTY